jgi:hypothetical protein
MLIISLEVLQERLVYKNYVCYMLCVICYVTMHMYVLFYVVRYNSIIAYHIQEYRFRLLG